MPRRKPWAMRRSASSFPAPSKANPRRVSRVCSKLRRRLASPSDRTVEPTHQAIPRSSMPSSICSANGTLMRTPQANGSQRLLESISRSDLGRLCGANEPARGPDPQNFPQSSVGLRRPERGADRLRIARSDWFTKSTKSCEISRSIDNARPGMLGHATSLRAQSLHPRGLHNLHVGPISRDLRPWLTRQNNPSPNACPSAPLAPVPRVPLQPP